MIHDLDRTILHLLEQEIEAVDKQEIGVSFLPPTGAWSTRINRPTLNFFLYDLRENAALRRHVWQPTGSKNGVRYDRPPLSLDCFYLVTAWLSGEDEDRAVQEHYLLSQCLRALVRYPILNPDQESASADHSKSGLILAGGLAATREEIRTRLANHDVLTNPAELWSALDNQIKAGFSYVITLPFDTSITSEADYRVAAFDIRLRRSQTRPSN
ncbi:MAG: DUF4255 domain-containing protein [Caldilineaceae bacterium]|nr:DUF4255 domain-containing protein [Caldilineaceae bacterium]